MTLNQNINQSFRRISLGILTILAISFIGLSLVESANSPQAQTRLDLMQTDLILQVSAWQPSSPEEATLKNLLIGSEDIYTQALIAYKDGLKSNQVTANSGGSGQNSQAQNSQNIDDLSIRLGILYAKTNKIPEAIATWQQVSFQASNTTQVLRGLWSEPALIFPEAEIQIASSLDGWFRTQALGRLYDAQQRSEAIAILRQAQAIEAEQAIDRLLLTSSVTIIGSGLGIVLILILSIQRLFFAKHSPLMANSGVNFDTPWQLSKVLEVMVLWFTAYIAVSQIFLPLVLSKLNILPDPSWSSKDRAILILIPYVASMAPMLLIFKNALREYFPYQLFKLKFWSWQWLGWGIGGYLVAIPIVLIVSVVNQNLLGGQGGGNPLLPILAEDQNNTAKLLLWMTVAIAAPVFEELLFRGFLLPSLISNFFNKQVKDRVNYQGINFLRVALAIAVSGLFFAIAHLNLADILPLTALGMVMGFVYVRSQNLLATMLLHSLWNSGTFFTLLALNGS